MDKQFYIRRIEKLGDEKLVELLRLKSSENLEIMMLAENEAIKRGIDLLTIEVTANKFKTPRTKSKKDEGINLASVLADILCGLS